MVPPQGRSINILAYLLLGYLHIPYLYADFASDQKKLVIAPIKHFDPNAHTIGVGLGWIRNNLPQASNRYSSMLFSAFNLHYELSPLPRGIFYNASFQDALAAEIGLFYYTIINFSKIDQAFRCVTPYIAGHYYLWFSSSFSVFGFVAYGKNFIIENTQSGDPDIQLLATSLIDFGGGWLAQIGPGWYWKTKLSLNMLYTGLGVRF